MFSLPGLMVRILHAEVWSPAYHIAEHHHGVTQDRHSMRFGIRINCLNYAPWIRVFPRTTRDNEDARRFVEHLWLKFPDNTQKILEPMRIDLRSIS